MRTPIITVTLNDPGDGAGRADALLKRGRYLDAIERNGGSPVPIDKTTSDADRAAAYDEMDGLLITGGGDIDPRRFGEEPHGSDPPDAGRDALDEEAYAAARSRGVPVLGICRGLQVINVFEGGSLIQHLEGHESESYPSPHVTTHPIAIRPGTRLAEALGATDSLVVNSYHHQAVTRERLSSSLEATAVATHPEHGELVEGFEAADPDRWLLGVQCHPERTESSPVELERIWATFVDACRAKSPDD